MSMLIEIAYFALKCLRPNFLSGGIRADVKTVNKAISQNQNCSVKQQRSFKQ